MKIEESIKWKDIECYEGIYQVSNYGSIRSLDRLSSDRRRLKGFVMSLTPTTNGYLQVRLCRDGISKTFKVHRLVAQAFIPNPCSLPQINHKDERKTNNSVDNLEWCTQSYNLKYGTFIERAVKNRNYNEISRKRSLTQSKEITQYDENGDIVAIWKNAYEAEKHGYNRTMVNQCCLENKKTHKGCTWEYTYFVEKQIPKQPANKVHEKYPTLGRNYYCQCGVMFVDFERNGTNYCGNCGQRLK